MAVLRKQGGSLRVLDLFAGLEGWSTPFRERGHDVFSVDFDERFDVDLHADVMTLSPGDLPWTPDVILASPPCEKFSVLAFGHHWLPGYKPKHEGTVAAMALVSRTIELIDDLAPAFWIVENPVGMLRKLHLIPYERQTVTYCQYGAPFRKATDLWGGFPPSLVLTPMCRNGDPCHVPAPRGSRTGIQSDTALENKDPRVIAHFTGGMLEGMTQHWSTSPDRRDMVALRAKIPHALALAVCLAAERDLAAGLIAADYSGRLFA